jgi:hypothetical protein
LLIFFYFLNKFNHCNIAQFLGSDEMEIDRRNLKIFLQKNAICDVLKNSSTTSFNDTSIESSFEYKMLPSNISESSFWVQILLYHTHRYRTRENFERLSLNDTNKKLFHKNTKALKALCIKGNRVACVMKINVCGLNLIVF